jgi:uncharacterized repeat protein (TIGR01451 family)
VRDVIIRTPGELYVTKTTECADTKDRIIFHTAVGNNTGSPVNDIVVNDTLPSGFILEGGEPAVTSGTGTGSPDRLYHHRHPVRRTHSLQVHGQRQREHPAFRHLQRTFRHHACGRAIRQQRRNHAPDRLYRNEYGPHGSTGERDYYANYLYSGREAVEVPASASEDKIWSFEDELYVRTSKPGAIIGMLHRQQTVVAAGETRIKLPPGIYIVTLNNGAGQKVMIE